MADAEGDGSLPAWVTVTEAARRLGVSRAAVYSRVKRGTAKARRGNAGVEVQWPLPEAESALRQGDAQAYAQGDGTLTDELRAERDEARMEAALLRQEVAELRERAGRAEGQAAILQDALGREQARADRLEAELREAHQEARRPWWRRLLG